jgi:predicted ArsR family transcriptional regulator
VDPNRLDGISEPELRDALLFVRGSREPVTADDAAGALGVHRSVARARLERLLRAGLLDTSFARRSGRRGPGAGRPAKLYRTAPEEEAMEVPPRHFPELVSRLLDELPATGRNEALRRAGAGFGDDLAQAARLRPAAEMKRALENVCTAVRSLGFQATLDGIEGDTAVISTPTCPLRPLVAKQPAAAEIDRGMWSALCARAARGMRTESVECETHSCLDGAESCAVVIRFRR